MSEKDFDWSDDLDIEFLDGEKDLEADYGEPEDGFSNFDDLSDYADSDEDATLGSGNKDPGSELPAEGQAQGDEAKGAGNIPAAAMAARFLPGQKKVVSPAGLGFLVAGCTLAAAVGMAGAFLVASGMDIRTLWNPSGLTSLNQIVNFQDHPQNLFVLVTLAVVLLAVMGAFHAVGQAKKANAQVHRSEGLLSRVTALRLDKEQPWTCDEFKSDPDTSAFVTDVLGAWRLQQARQVRSVGLEGEIRRLEKALRDNSRDDLSDRYDHPLVGTLADVMVSWYDDRDAARKEAAAAKAKDELDSGEILTLIEDARSWNQANSQRVDVQGVTLQRWSTKFTDMAEKYSKQSGQSEAISGLQGLQKDLSRATANDSAESLATLDDLVDRGSKLAFQIAMEVARLGPRGERLLPMTQALEEQTTLFRQTVAKAKSGGRNETANPQAVLTRLEQITLQLVKEGPGGSGNLIHTLKDLGPASRKLADNLEEISSSFGQQGIRLNNLGTNFAALTGLEFDSGNLAEGEPVNPPEGNMNITQSDPFGKEEHLQDTSFEFDPFGGTTEPLSADSAILPDTGFTSNVTPGEEDALQVEAFASEDPFEKEKAFEPESEPELSSQEEKVYDLSEFGAVRVDQVNDGLVSTEDEDRVYDLAEFGAVAMN